MGLYQSRLSNERTASRRDQARISETDADALWTLETDSTGHCLEQPAGVACRTTGSQNRRYR